MANFNFRSKNNVQTLTGSTGHIESGHMLSISSSPMLNNLNHRRLKVGTRIAIATAIFSEHLLNVRHGV